ncbi:MAG: hypothetical protein JXB39_14120 [Deltaproteobacteria bacterium]|nr:hypothetical protein [Deltaproteobacteria bacterium]
MAAFRVLLLILLLGWLPRAARAEVALVTPDGPLVPGVENRVYVVLHEAGRALSTPRPTLRASIGDVAPGTGARRPGVHAFWYLAPPGASGSVTFTVHTDPDTSTRLVVPLGDPVVPTFEGPVRMEATAGADRPIRVPFRSAEPVNPDVLQAYATEGRILSVERTADGVDVVLEPLEERFPRVVLVGLLDLRRPVAPPAWGVVHLAGRPRIPIQTEPGARVHLTLGGRTFGPFVADAEGQAVATLPVRPGDATATMRIEDDLGNVQTTTVSLQRDPRPLVALLSAPVLLQGGAVFPVHLAVVDFAGAPWTAALPVCETVPGGRPALVSEGPGRWRLLPSLPSEERFLYLRVSCELPGDLAAAQVRLPVGEGIPHTLHLKVYPEVLSADFPMAQVQAILEDRLGDRLALDAVEVGADLGEVRVVSSDAHTIRADYNGAPAAAEGSDRIWARLAIAPGTGPPASLQVTHGTAEGGRLPVHARVLDGRGRPLEGIGVALALDRGPESTATTDARGWACATFPLPADVPLVILHARTGLLEAREPYLPEDPGPSADVSAPDVEAVVEVPILAGRVRRVSIATEPSVLHPGPSASARVLVRLQDRTGSAVTDDHATVRADVGTVSPLKIRPDGSYEAWYTPPAGFRAGDVLLSVQGQEGSFGASTTLRIAPRPLRAALGITGGFLSNLGSVASPTADVNLEMRLPFGSERILLRTSTGVYGADAVLEDHATGEEISVRQVFLPVTLAGLARQEQGLRASWLGAGLAGIGWTAAASFGDETTVRLHGVSGPGLTLFAGTGWRAGTGEFGFELRYLYATIGEDALAWEGTVGGLSVVTGWRVLF